MRSRSLYLENQILDASRGISILTFGISTTTTHGNTINNSSLSLFFCFLYIYKTDSSRVWVHYNLVRLSSFIPTISIINYIPIEFLNTQYIVPL